MDRKKKKEEKSGKPTETLNMQCTGGSSTLVYNRKTSNDEPGAKTVINTQIILKISLTVAYNIAAYKVEGNVDGAQQGFQSVRKN